MKRKLTPQQKKLQAEFDRMMAAHARPLERGAVAKGAVSSAAPKAKSRGVHMMEASRVNREKSVDTGYTSTAPKVVQQYTGDKVMGVALMHKSSYAPVFNAEAAVDIAKMRRG
jgi:hypothetical protein